MTRAPEVEGAPRAHLATPSHWPHGEIDPAKDHPAARYARAFSATLAEVIGKMSYREVGRRCDLAHGTVSAVVRGDVWPDLITVSKLESGLGHILWPGPMLFAEQVRKLRVFQADYQRMLARRDFR